MSGRRIVLGAVRFSIAAVATLGTGCRNNTSSAGPPPTESVVAALNASPKTSDFVIEASNSVRLQTGGLVVNGGDIGALGTTGPFLGDGAAVDALTGVQVQNTHTIIASTVNLGTGAVVGDIEATHVTVGTGAKHGTIAGLAPLPAIPAAATVSPGTTNVTVATGATVTISPGHFAAINVGTGGTLKMAAGSYDLASLTMSSGAKIAAQGAIQIHVAGRLSTSSGVFITAAPGVNLTASGIRIEVSGQNGTTGALGATPAAAAFGTGNNVTALVLVPKGTLVFGTGATATGAFMGRDVDLGGAGAKIVYQDGFPNTGATCTPPSCDDGNPCTVDSCGSNGVCTHAPTAAGTSCSDGNSCNGAETCDGSGACKPGAPVICAPQDQCHVAGTCDPTTGACSNPVAANGTACNDGNACTSGETCQAGACTGGAAVTCAGADQCHTAGACVPATGCPAPVAVANGTACNDGNACTTGDTCQAGACTGGSAVTCAAADQCHSQGACVPATGCPALVAKANGTTCNDGNACTTGDTCQAGACTGGSAVTCAAADQCHSQGACVPATGCPTPVAKANGTTCNDGNACTTGETCQSGACTGGTAVTCAGADQCNTVGACVPGAGCPAPVAKANGTACNDDNACTQTDSCQNGTCTGSNSITCRAADACHDVGTCAPATGVCSNPLMPAGTTCGTGEVCTAKGQCLSPGNQAPVVNAGPNQTASELLGAPPPTFTLQPISTAFNSPVGIGYYQPTNQMIMSVNCCDGEPHNFDIVDAQGNHQQFSNINGLSNEVYFAIARDEGGGRSRGGFLEGEMLVGTGDPGTIARVSPDGSTIEDPWVVLPGEPGLLRGQLYLDQTGLYGGDLIVTTTANNLWRVTAAGVTTKIPTTTLQGGNLEGLVTVPADPVKYGPWAGMILIGDENTNGIYAVDPLGNTTLYPLGLFPEDIMIVPPNQNFFGVDYYGGLLWGASASQFTGMVGDIIVAEENGGRLWDIKWNGTSFDTTLLAQVDLWEHTTFAPAGISQVGAAGVVTPLAGTATDDGLPAGSTLTVQWTVISGPGPVTFANSQLAATTASFTAPGTYVLQLSASDGQLTSTSQTTVVVQSVDPANQAPIPDAGPAQTITLPAAAQLTGSATDDGLPEGSFITTSWSQFSGPGTATFVNPNAALTDVLFSAPGTYVLQLSASDGELTGTATVTITVNPVPSLVGGQLTAALSSPGPLPTGTTETLTALLTDSGANPILNFPVQVVVTGANPTSGTVVTNATGHATFTYFGNNLGTDVLIATATTGATQLQSAPQSVAWTLNGGAVVTQGWIASPAHQATVMGQVPIVLSNNVTLVSGTVSYWPTANPSDVHVIDSNAHGAPGATIDTLDTTTLKNGSYIVDLTGVDNGGNTQDSQIAVTVSGDYKPGRKIVEVTDLTIPIVGLPITIGRRYDSLDKDNVGDFGNGWSLTIGHPDLQVDPGNNVTMTMPNGRRVTFFFTPVSYPFPFSYLFQPAYVPEAGVFGTLTSDGCALLVPSGGQVLCFEDSSTTYAPTSYTYTDAYGIVYTLGADGSLKSIQDRNGNNLTFSPTGILSSSNSENVSFVRDSSGRITKVLSPPVDSSGAVNEYDYTYDASGDLVTVKRPPSSGPISLQYTYDGNHRLLTAVDANGNPARTSTYDDTGRLVADQDGLGNITRYVYDLVARTTTTTHPDTGVAVSTFDDRGLLLSLTDPLGRTTTHTYDANRNETKRIDPLGEATAYTYDANGNQTSSTNALGETTSTTYNAFSEPLTVTNPIGNTVTKVYDDTGLPATFADSLGLLTTFISTPSGRPISLTDALGNSSLRTYDAVGNLTSIADRLTRTTRYTSDGLGRTTSTTDPRGDTLAYSYFPDGTLSSLLDPAGLLETYAYDGNGNLLSRTDAFGPRSTHYQYDADNNAIQIIEPDGNIASATYDFRGNRLTETDEVGNVTSYEYDLAGELVRTTNTDGTFTQRGYDSLGRLATKTDERGNVTTFAYEAGCGCADRLTSTTDPLGRTTSATYDGMGRKTSQTDPAGHQTFYSYDLRGHLTETDYADGTTVKNVYDAVGRRITTTDQTGATTQFNYDAEGQLVKVTDPLENATQYLYDANGNVAAIFDANDHLSTYAYDPDNRETARTLPLGLTESYQYDLVGNAVAHTDFRGKTTTYSYDLRNHLIGKVPDASLGEPAIAYTYNPTGARASMTDATGVTTYSYDGKNRLLTKAAPAGTLAYTYDASGNIATIRSSNPNGTSVDYLSDAANQLVSVTDNGLGAITKAEYSATRQLERLVLPNQVNATVAYDPLDRASSMVWRNGTASPFASLSYTYNGRGQRLMAVEASGREATYGYDADARLMSEEVSGDPSGPGGNGLITYSLDPAGNRLSRTSGLAALGNQSFQYDPNDQLSSDTYDGNGNTTALATDSYAYDFENHLLSKNGGAVTFAYDGDGTRVAKTVGGTTTRYLVADLSPTGYSQVLEEVVNGSTQVRYTYGRSVISQTRDASGTPQTSFYVRDAHGNIMFLTNAAGAVTDSYDYDAWGNVVASSGTTQNTRLFAGESFEPDLGVLALRARDYDPQRGRFLTIDLQQAPSRHPLTLNRYLYADADPVNLVDPLGTEAEEESFLLEAGMTILNQASEGFLDILENSAERYGGDTEVGEILKNTASFYNNAAEDFDKGFGREYGHTVGLGLTTACEFQIVTSAFDLGTTGELGDLGVCVIKSPYPPPLIQLPPPPPGVPPVPYFGPNPIPPIPFVPTQIL
ncbi:MAG TPA: RHS repeat-associated core domain-containing protein [Polyangia bacterium]|nr:RHS repeat-associated core domain-containing protein [Polyangia bacterium]